jgi:hypothetical protein
MNPIWRFVRAIFYWSYPRGSWQWDLMCLAIIVAIFATPQDFLQDSTRHPLTPEQIRQIIANWLFH